MDDIIEGVVRFMDTNNGFVGPVNLGNPQELAIRDLAKKILELTGSRSTIAHKPLPDDDPRCRQPNIQLARDRFGWEPQCKLEDGLSKTIAYFDSLLSKGLVLEQRAELQAV